MDHLKLTEEKLSVEEIVDLVVSAKCGAVSTFIGTTRDNFDGKDVVKLEYEAYENMCLKSLKSLCDELRKIWPDVVNIAIYHRLGTVPVKEASVVIAISSPHRGDAIKATEWCIENLKKSVPIWKKEVYADDNSEWKQNKELPRKEDKIEERTVPSHLILIKAPRSEIDQRIEHFIAKKRSEIDSANVRDFCRRREDQTIEFSCARIDSALVKRKDSKGHLQVNKVYNDYSHRDQSGQDYMMKFIPKDGIEERLANLESQLSLAKSTPQSVYERLKSLEDRLLTLESISPEYVQFWDKVEFSQKSTKRKKVWSIDEIDGILRDLEAKANSTK